MSTRRSPPILWTDLRFRTREQVTAVPGPLELSMQVKSIEFETAAGQFQRFARWQDLPTQLRSDAGRGIFSRRSTRRNDMQRVPRGDLIAYESGSKCGLDLRTLQPNTLRRLSTDHGAQGTVLGVVLRLAQRGLLIAAPLCIMRKRMRATSHQYGQDQADKERPASQLGGTHLTEAAHDYILDRLPEHCQVQPIALDCSFSVLTRARR